jgi:GGDEF domain-containing protein
VSPPRLPRRYWDSNAFLGVLLGEQDKVPDCQTVLKAGKDRRLTLPVQSLHRSALRLSQSTAPTQPTLMEGADAALYAAKNRGRDCIEVCPIVRQRPLVRRRL